LADDAELRAKTDFEKAVTGGSDSQAVEGNEFTSNSRRKNLSAPWTDGWACDFAC